MHAKEKFSILLVDDDPTVIHMLSRILTDYAPLRFATSGPAALALARETVPDLMMLDVEMPAVGGFEISQAFKSDPKLAAVPIIFITSHDNADIEAVRFQLGGADFISKPPHAPLVLARVRTYQQLKALSDTMANASTMDFLTGTGTRQQLEQTLGQEWLRSQRSHAPLSLMIADIDRFSCINSEWGDALGDACLRTVADALRSVAQRPTDLIARYGGGKFALLMPETSNEGAIRIAERTLRVIDELPNFALQGTGRQRVTLSIGGVTNVPGNGFSQGPLTCGVPADLILAAEYAVKCAKSAGGHRAEFVNISRFVLPEPQRVEH